MADEKLPVVLVVDDETLFLRAVTDGFAPLSDRVDLRTASDGRLALAVLENEHVDLVVTDLAMPVMGGFELIARMSERFPKIPVLVMTAFGTEEIDRRLENFGILRHLPKPIDVKTLRARVLDALHGSASGQIQGIALPTFLQMIEMDRKTCTVKVRAGKQSALLHFRDGKLLDASTPTARGDDAVLELVCWPRPVIEIVSGRVHCERTVRSSLASVLLEAFRRRDEQERARAESSESSALPDAGMTVLAPSEPAAGSVEGNQAEWVDLTLDEPAGEQSPQPGQKERAMAAQDKIRELTNIEGFLGGAVYTPTGEMLASQAGEAANLNNVGILANNTLLNAQKTSLEMGVGRGQQVHIEAEKAHFLVRCLNEGTDPLKSQPGKAHIHMVVMLRPDASIGYAKMKVNAVMEKLAEDFRM